MTDNPMDITLKRPAGSSALAEQLEQMSSGVVQIYDDAQKLLLVQDRQGKVILTIAQSIDTLVEDRAAQIQERALNAELRDTVVGCTRDVHTDTQALINHIEALLPQLLPAPPEPVSWKTWLLHGSGVAVGALVVGTLWWGWPASRYERFAVALDSAVVQTYSQLGKGTQDELERLYLRHGIEPPGTRQKKASR